jgi:hypothetical protein
MGSSLVQNPLFDEPQGYEFPGDGFSPRADYRLHSALRGFTPTLIALGGLALFAGALVVAFRIITLDATRQLQQPAIDFAICGAIAFLGLSISWVHLGERPAKTEVQEFAVEVESEPKPLRKGLSQPPVAGHPCPFCCQNMMSLGLARYYCEGCGHLEGNVPVSFLDSASLCSCDNCRQSPQHAV